MRNMGKEVVLACLAEDTEILTQKGWIKIQDLLEDDLLWNGEEYVKHGGLVERGKKDCIEVKGITLTPDHLIFNGQTFEESKDANSKKSAKWASRNLPVKK